VIGALLIGASLGLMALAVYLRVLRIRHERRLARRGGGLPATVGSWLAVAGLLGSARLVSVAAVWAAAATFLVSHRLWLMASVRVVQGESEKRGG
jgi:hypothetical protein